MNPLLLYCAPSLGGCGGSTGICDLGRVLSVPDKCNCTLKGAYRDTMTDLLSCLCQNRPRDLRPCVAEVRYTCVQARADGVLSFKQARHEEQTVGTVTDISQGSLACVRFPQLFYIWQIR